MRDKRLESRNAAIAEMLADGEKLKNFYRFAAQNPHIPLHDACQIVVNRPDAGVCYSFGEWNAMGRRITKGRSGIAYYDYDGYKQFVYDANDTHGDSRYQRPILPMKRLLAGLDELNGTELAGGERSDWHKIKSGVKEYLRKQSLSGDGFRDGLFAEGIAFSLYAKTGFPKSAGINLHGLPYSYRGNAELVKEICVETDVLAQEIEDAYYRKRNEVRFIDDTEEETVSDEPVIPSAPAEQAGKEENPTEEKYVVQTKHDPTECVVIVEQTEEQPKVTPYYQKYLDAQKLKPQAVVVIRLGDFYEIMGEKARVIADELDLTLTGRDVGLSERVPMCGMPYHAMDRYLDKILERHGVLLVDGEEEPKYILSYAEALGQSENKQPEPAGYAHDPYELTELEELYAESFSGKAEEQVQEPNRPQFIVVDDDEPNPFDGEQSEKQEDNGEENTEPSGQDGKSKADGEQPREKVKSTAKKQEQGIKDRKRRQKPQLTLFEIYDPKEQSQKEQMIERQLKLGSRVAQGKFRIFDKYHENPTVKAFADFLKKEYGIGGFSYGADGQEHDGKGVRMTLYAEGNRKTEEVFLKWNEVAIRTADLIDDDNYFSEQEKREYVAYRSELSRIKALRAEEERQKNECVAKVLRCAPKERKKQIRDGFTKTQSAEEFVGFIRNLHGYQTVDEGENFRVLYNPVGIFISQYDEKGNRDKGYCLRWEELAVILSKLIGDAQYLSPAGGKPFNPFKELSAERKAIFERYQKSPIREPETSPWGEIQHCTVIANGIYSVSTAGHGGIMIAEELAPYILSPKAIAAGFSESGYSCYEEDCDGGIPLRELYDKGIIDKANVYFTKSYVRSDKAESGYIPFTELSEEEQEALFNEWDRTLNESLAQWNPDYWAAHGQAEEGEDSRHGLDDKSGGENTDLNGVLDQSGFGGQKSRFQGNVAAIKLVNRLYAENRNPTEEERKILSRYVGWGGMPQAFDEANKQWQREYNELKGLLSSEGYEQAKSSTLNAYYTPKEVIDGVYSALKRLGVRGNNRILEPSMGTGNFFGYMPKEIADGSRLYGVELDNVTGRIAAKLYPQANVQIKGFEDTGFPDDKFDVVVGNVPFGGYGIADSDYNRYHFKVHDYFLAKSIDKVKPNGIVAVVTSKGTMDKLNPSARKYVAERAELLGAIRLPNTAFRQTASTEAVTDILFFQKREEKITDVSEEEWLSTGRTEAGYEINRYFINHPEAVLGTLAEEFGLYGKRGVTVKADGRKLSAALRDAVQKLPCDVFTAPSAPPGADGLNEADYRVKPLCYQADGGRLYMRIGDEMVEQAIPQTPKDAYQRIKSMIALREELHRILDIQIQGCPDEALKEEQRKLNAQYDRFVRLYGNLNSQINTRLFRDDGDSALLFACENIDKETGAVTKTDVFSKRTIRPYAAPPSTSDCFEALQISKNERGRADIAYIEELTKKDYETVVTELGEAVFRDPEKTDEGDRYSGFVTAEEYLSGKVVEKLRMARTASERNPEYRRNVTALSDAQPTPLTAGEISVRLGASWVDKEYYKQFYLELINAPLFLRGEVGLFYNPHDSSWRLDQDPKVRKYTDMKQKQVYGTPRAPAYRLFTDALNLKTVTVYDTIEEDGKEKRVVNQAETIAAREKQNKIKEAFRNWIFATPKRRAELEATYNSLFNQIRLPEYDGSYLRFPGMNPAIELRPHQKNAVHRIITEGSALLHHVVGSGKTYTCIAAVMKMRQLGLCKKAMVAVPNHLVTQWANDWRKLYPNANILVATKEDLEKDNRKKFVSRAALGDWDGIIIAQSSFAKINISSERQIKQLKEEIESIGLTIEKQWEENGMPRGAVKNLEKIKKSREAQLKKLMADEKKDDVLIFESLGVDYLFIDEAHYYKNRFLFTKMNNVAGISNAASQRATDLQLKCGYLQELHGSDKGVVFATGTPVSNSMTEMYTMQSYLQPSVLKENGLTFFDAWAADFGETVTSMELSPSGQGYRARARFAKFTNLPELMTMYRSFADVQTGDTVILDVPEAERKVISLKPSETVIELAERIAERAEIIHDGGVKPEDDNMLKVTSDGKKLALDPRCFVPGSADEAGSKLNEAAIRIYEIWEGSKDQKLTQLVFCDLSTPKKRYEDYVYGVDFDAYNDLKYKLVQKGIPAEEVAFIHDATTDESKQALFDNVNSGKVRVLVGSTEKCGAGTNVQKRLIALHHLDTPYRPSDMEQREGRIIRQGNTNDAVRIYTYVMERTFDSYSYQILENKQRFISQICNGDFTAREFEDTDETTLSYAEIKAITAANPKIKRKMEVDTEIARLRTLEGQYKKNKYALQDKLIKYYPEEIRRQELLIRQVTADLNLFRSKSPATAEAFEINVNGKVYTSRKEGGRALADALRQSKPETVVAEYCGFQISMNPVQFIADERKITLSAQGQYTVEIGESAIGNLIRIDNLMEGFPEQKERLESRLRQLQSDMAVTAEQSGLPFEHEQQLLALLSEQAELNAELNLDKREEVIIDDGNGDGEDGGDSYKALPDRRYDRMTDKEEKDSLIQELSDDAAGTDFEKEVRASVEEEYKSFRTEMLARSPSEIFDSYYQIQSYGYFTEVITCGDRYLSADDFRTLYPDRGRILNVLYGEFLDSLGYSNGVYEDMADFIKQYCKERSAEANASAVYYGKAGNTAYYRFTAALSQDTLPQLTQEADSYAVAALANELDEGESEEKNIIFLQTGRDVSEEELSDREKAIDTMRQAVHRILSAQRREYLDRLNFHMECKEAIETAIRNNYDGMHLKDDFGALFGRYDFEEIKYVLANTVQCFSEDGRISKDNKAWADGSKITENEGNRYQFVLHTHPAVLDGFIDVIRRKEKETEVGKRVVYYTVKAVEQDGRRGYTALYADEKSGESGPLYTRTFDTEEEVRSVIAKLNASKDAHRKEYYEYLTPERFDKLRDEIVKAHTERTLQGKFLNETKQGYVVLSLMKDEHERNVAIVYRPKTNDYIVAAGYDTSTGEWMQGIYVETGEEAEQIRKGVYGDRPIIYENEEGINLAETENRKWLAVYVSKDALIRKYDRTSFMRMPATNEAYGEYTYNVFNSRIKESRQPADSERDGGELCYKILLREDETVLLKTRDGEKAELTAQEFQELVNRTTDKDYERRERADRIRADIPQEAIIKKYENSTLFAAPVTSEAKGYVYYLPNSVIHENTEKEDGSLYVSLGEDFTVTLRKGEEEKKLTAREYAALVNGGQVEDYKREITETEEYRERQDGDGRRWFTIPISEEAVIANYEKTRF